MTHLRIGATAIGRLGAVEGGRTKVRTYLQREALRTTTGTQDLSVPGVSHDAVLVWGNVATTEATPVATARDSFGFATATNARRVWAGRINDGVTTDTDGHYASASAVHAILEVGEQDPEVVVDLNAFGDTVVLDVEETNGVARLLHALTISGPVTAATTTLTVSTNVDGNAQAAIAFEPNLIIMFCDGDQPDASPTHSGMTNFSLGFFRNDKAGTVDHACITVARRGDAEVRGTAGNFGQVSTSRFLIADPTYDAAGPDWEFELSFPTSSILRVRTKVVGDDPAPPQIGILYLDVPCDVAVGIIETPDEVGSHELDLGCDFTPQALVAAVSRITATNTWRASSAEAGTCGLAAATDDDQFCATTSSANLASPTDASSVAVSRLWHVPDETGADPLEADFEAFTFGGMTVEVESAPASCRFPFFAIASDFGFAGLATRITLDPFGGGNDVYSLGGYTYRAFTSSGTLTFSGENPVDVEYLVVAGGGSGGAFNNGGGGGGAGGLRTGTLSISGNTTVTVGTGGPAQTAANTNGNAGSNSVLGAITATGGAAGGGNPGGNGGSGGGGSGSSGAPNAGGTGTSGQGSNGGQGFGSGTASLRAGGGGGGASAVGGDASSNVAGVGGAGTAWNGTTYATGGDGGRSGTTGNRTNAAANTGDGGAGGHNGGGDSGAGGSGVVIVRYQL